MALTDSLPTGDAGGLTVVDERLILSGLIAKNADGSPRVGVFPSGVGPLVTGRASMGYDVAPFRAATSRTGTGVELLANDATVTNVPTDPAPGANSRLDVIYVRPQFTANADPGNVPIFGVAKGAAAGVPTKPPIPAGALELAVAQIPSSATTTASVVITQTAPWTAAAGGIVPLRNDPELTAYAAPEGTTARRLDTGRLYRRSDGAWVPDRPDTGWVALTTLGPGWKLPGGDLNPEIRAEGDVVTIRGFLEVTTGGTTFTDLVRIWSAYYPTKSTWYSYTRASSGGSVQGFLAVSPTGQISMPSGYREGSFAVGQLLPISGTYMRG